MWRSTIPQGRSLSRRGFHSGPAIPPLNVDRSLVVDHARPLPGFYRHYKHNNLYQVTGSVLHTETNEDMVLYQEAPDTGKHPSSQFFVRPTKMFMGTVEHEGKEVPRFKRVCDPSISIWAMFLFSFFRIG